MHKVEKRRDIRTRVQENQAGDDGEIEDLKARSAASIPVGKVERLLIKRASPKTCLHEKGHKKREWPSRNDNKFMRGQRNRNKKKGPNNFSNDLEEGERDANTAFI